MHIAHVRQVEKPRAIIRFQARKIVVRRIDIQTSEKRKKIENNY